MDGLDNHDNLKSMFARRLCLPSPARESFFLWGPRQTGKSTLLRAAYPLAPRIDLLKTDLHLRYAREPHRLREEFDTPDAARFVIIDEVQKVPALLDEVHWLIENRGVVFALCGSSARKVRREHANLLGGRAVSHQLFGLVSAELGEQFDIVRALNHGYLPRHYKSDSPQPLLRSYVNDYLKEEVLSEGLTRRLQPFAEFLGAAALSDAEIVNYANIARDCGVSEPTVKAYFQILVDTLLARFLPAYRKRPKRRVIRAAKFYFADVGVANHLARRGVLAPGSDVFGKAFENWVFHEIDAHRTYAGSFEELAYWRLAAGTEVDFIVGAMEFAIEAKASTKIHDGHLVGLRQVLVDHPRIKRRILVSLESNPRRTSDGIDILGVRTFCERLWGGDLLR